MNQRQTLPTRTHRRATAASLPVAPAPPSKSKSAPAASTAEDRHALIAAQAYYLAERRGFTPGAELDDWLAAEAQVDARLREAEGSDTGERSA